EGGRADVDDVVENEQFCVEDLRLVFVDLDAAAHEHPIEAATGQLGQCHIGFAGEDQLNAATPFADAQEFFAQSPGRQKIGADEPDGVRPRKVFALRAAAFAGVPARSGHDECPVPTFAAFV